MQVWWLPATRTRGATRPGGGGGLQGAGEGLRAQGGYGATPKLGNGVVNDPAVFGVCWRWILARTQVSALCQHATMSRNPVFCAVPCVLSVSPGRNAGFWKPASRQRLIWDVCGYNSLAGARKRPCSRQGANALFAQRTLRHSSAVSFQRSSLL